MPADTDEILVGANGKVYVAPTGSTLPTDSDTALDAAFVDLGYVSEDGVSFSDSKDIEAIPAWQSFYPVRRVVSSKDSNVAFELLQWNADTIEFAFGGGAIVTAAGEHTYTPPDPEDIDYRAMVVEWIDGTRNYRLVIPRGMVTEGVETNFVRTGAAGLPITFSVTPEAGEDPWTLLTDDAAFA